jgi:hypothetical protein
MRWVVALTLMAGCTDGNAPPVLVNDDFAVGDLNEDLSLEDQGNPDLLPTGCRTACDCPNGQACISSMCSAAQQVFCCGTAMCTGASLCQFPDGRISQCANPSDGGVQPDAGSMSACTSTACTPGLGSQLFCSLACGTLTAMCSGATGHCQP